MDWGKRAEVQGWEVSLQSLLTVRGFITQEGFLLHDVHGDFNIRDFFIVRIIRLSERGNTSWERTSGDRGVFINTQEKSIALQTSLSRSFSNLSFVFLLNQTTGLQLGWTQRKQDKTVSPNGTPWINHHQTVRRSEFLFGKKQTGGSLVTPPQLQGFFYIPPPMHGSRVWSITRLMEDPNPSTTWGLGFYGGKNCIISKCLTWKWRTEGICRLFVEESEHFPHKSVILYATFSFGKYFLETSKMQNLWVLLSWWFRHLCVALLEKKLYFKCSLKERHKKETNDIILTSLFSEVIKAWIVRLQHRCLWRHISSSRPPSFSCLSLGWHHPGSRGRAGRTCSPWLSSQRPEQGSENTRNRTDSFYIC